MNENVQQSQWYYAAGTERKGPFTEDKIKTLHEAGVVTSETMVWTEPMHDWQTAGSTRLSAIVGESLPSLQTQHAFASHQSYPSPPSGQNSAGTPMGFFEAFSHCLQKYAVFSGRASRSEYWYFILAGTLIGLIAIFFDIVLFNSSLDSDLSPLNTITSLALLLPQLAVGIRRLHDIDRTGWWLLLIFIPIIGWIALLVFFCSKPTEGPNRFNI